MNWLISFINFIAKNFFKKKKNSGKIIPEKFHKDDIIVRGIFTPLYISSKKILREGAFLPPPKRQERDVSVLRHSYTDDNFCKNHCYKINLGQSYYSGLAFFLIKHMEDLVNKHNLQDSVYMRFSPLQEDYRTPITERPIFTHFRGLPMHADIYYNGEFTPGKPQTKFRLFAKELATNFSYYFEDPQPNEPGWIGKKIKYPIVS